MNKPDTPKEDFTANPFLTDQADKLWKKIDEGGKPISKEELLKRIRKIKRNK